jgi:hypothetical protein
MRPGSIGWHGNAILVGPKVDIVQHMPLHLPSLEPRGAVLADVRVRGKPLRLVGMHLDLSGLWRRKQARAILTELGHQPHHLPTLLAGDLNEWRNAGCIRDFCQHHRPVTLGPSFHARQPVGRLTACSSVRRSRFSNPASTTPCSRATRPIICRSGRESACESVCREIGADSGFQSARSRSIVDSTRFERTE